jgi:hypothetical protein
MPMRKKRTLAIKKMMHLFRYIYYFRSLADSIFLCS